MKVEFVLDYKKDIELFNKTAEAMADSIASAKPETNTTQMRKFYDSVLELYDRSLMAEKDFNEILPFVKMLNSKVSYAKERKHANDAFVGMINDCVRQVDSKEKLEVFKLFFEAVLGFSKSKKDKR
ncbi:type III-A CRISPR-associated protein Csm2 [Campylobacter sp. RM16187]|uniref:type III-A CRISPR-associated protein Csm2 n=1 Tax=Campylobacter sp. RM16187 TaxID=1660063 RepID=UPI0021B67185|nr:type III-A CRISPR-associated protein Csm2 [Campylobacter sp. RM16187]QKG28702.1 CRISPR/Cas system-associated protein Csm2, type III-A/MTUBE [Campylobacter sp. RM16187]